MGNDEFSRNQSSRIDQIELLNYNSKSSAAGSNLRNNEFFIEKVSTTQPRVILDRFLMTTDIGLRDLNIGYICSQLENDPICQKYLPSRLSSDPHGNHMYHLALFNLNFNSDIWSSNLSGSILSNSNQPVQCAAGLEARAEICRIHSDTSVRRTRLNTNNSIAYCVEFSPEWVRCQVAFLDS